MTKIIYSPIEGATNRKFTQRLKFIIFLFGLLMAQSCGQKQGEATDDLSTTDSNMITLTAAQFKAANISLGKIERRPMGTTLQVNGMLDVPPQNLITVSAPPVRSPLGKEAGGGGGGPNGAAFFKFLLDFSNE